MNIIPWKRSSSPLRSSGSLFTLQDDMNRMFDSFFDWGFAENSTTSVPAVDVSESDSDYMISAELPGMEAKDIELKVGEGYLTLRGEKKESHEEKDKTYVRRESRYGTFQRTISLPDIANCEECQAAFKNGVLKITVPKQPGSQQTERKIEINTS